MPGERLSDGRLAVRGLCVEANEILGGLPIAVDGVMNGVRGCWEWEISLRETLNGGTSKRLIGTDKEVRATGAKERAKRN